MTGVGDAGGRHGGQTVAGVDRLAVLGHHLPIIELVPAHAIGRPQWLDRGGEGHHREVGDKQEPD